MLKVRTKEQGRTIEFMNNVCRISDDGLGVHLANKEMSFDDMAAIVDFLRKEEKERRKKARSSAFRSEIDGLWVAGDTVFLRGVEDEEAEKFIRSLGAFGYDTDWLMNEFKKQKKITI